MATDFPISCACGHLTGVLRQAGPARGERMRCYCIDCQTYAHHLGTAENTLDAHGGTTLFQTTQGGLEILSGKENLAALRLSPKGPTRWYAKCCNTPIANTLSKGRLPFMALVSSCWRGSPESLGPERSAVHGQDAKGDRQNLAAADGVPFPVVARVGKRVLLAALRGEAKKSEFFDAYGKPVCTPTIVSREQRQAAKALCKA